ncbi:MAG: PIN domain-containing protein [Melioribacteraceae bacterium]
MHKILVDTCVWLDMAKDPEQQALLNVIEELVKRNELSLIVPRIVVEEFARNKERIIKESSQSLSSVFKRVKDFVDKFGDPKKKKAVLEQLNDVDYKIPSLGENAIVSVTRIEKLLKGSTIIETTDTIKLKAAQRAIEKRAPFHRQKNSINDAIIIETYAACIQNKNSIGIRFAFVTHNKNDFSLPNGNDKIPHPDFAMYFSKIKSQYFIKLAEAVHRISPDLVTDIMIEDEWFEEPRSLTEILEAEKEFFDKIWYNRHQNWLYRIKIGEDKIVDTVPKGKYIPNVTPREIFKGARKAAKNVEERYGIKNLGPWDDFEWGMMNGKLSALRWVAGEEWDNLDT